MSDAVISFREANRADLPKLIEMLADDLLGSKRERFENPLPDPYLKAFEAIDSDANNQLIIAVIKEEIIGFMQLTIIPYLTYQGRPRALVEGVRVTKQYRNQGIGKRLILWAIKRAQEKGCHLIQLTTDKQRPDAIKFYESLGFNATHEGMKLHFD